MHTPCDSTVGHRRNDSTEGGQQWAAAGCGALPGVSTPDLQMSPGDGEGTGSLSQVQPCQPQNFRNGGQGQAPGASGENTSLPVRRCGPGPRRPQAGSARPVHGRTSARPRHPHPVPRSSSPAQEVALTIFDDRDVDWRRAGDGHQRLLGGHDQVPPRPQTHKPRVVLALSLQASQPHALPHDWPTRTRLLARRPISGGPNPRSISQPMGGIG
jgi:hypothetical protein